MVMDIEVPAPDIRDIHWISSKSRGPRVPHRGPALSILTNQRQVLEV